MSEFVTEQLAGWAIGLQSADLPEDVLDKAGDCILDAIACAVAGKDSLAAKRVGATAKRTFGPGTAAIWFAQGSLQPVGAAFVNAAMASALDIDDGHRRSTGHPGAAVVPAALAMCQADDKGIDLLANVVAGYEVSVRGGMSEKHRSYHSGNYTGLGAATVVARANGLNAEELMHALATTVYHGPRVADLTLSKDMGSNVKESIPWSVVAGMMAADLAGEGFTGCRDAMDITERYSPALALEGLADGYFPKAQGGEGVTHAILRTYFKRYACCRWCHSAVEALLRILRDNDLPVSDIQHIHVDTFRQSAELNNLSNPPSLESAQFSVPFCMAVAAIRGENALAPMEPGVLGNASVVDLARKITVRHEPSMDPLFPGQNPSRVVVTTKGGQFDALVLSPWGEPDHPPSRDELIVKFRSLAEGRLPDQQTEAIIAAVQALPSGTVGPLLETLKTK
ncbi:MAG: MmgE/PrpD family protein [Sulfitobacter sp.]